MLSPVVKIGINNIFMSNIYYDTLKSRVHTVYLY